MIYNLRNSTTFNKRNTHSVSYGTEALSHLRPKIWAIIPDAIKDSKTLTIFNSKIKIWTHTSLHVVYAELIFQMSVLT